MRWNFSLLTETKRTEKGTEEGERRRDSKKGVKDIEGESCRNNFEDFFGQFEVGEGGYLLVINGIIN